jgi:hypothetical protein
MGRLIKLFDLNPSLDRPDAALRFTESRRVQVRDVLTHEAAQAVLRILEQQTPWGLAWQAAGDGPHSTRRDDLAQMPAGERLAAVGRIKQVMEGSGYGFVYGQYPMLEAYLKEWDPGSPLDLILEHINAEPFLQLVRDVTGTPELIKADAQATLFGPNQFLALHNDSDVREGRRIAYVLNFCAREWRPDWGGYLLFYDEEGDVIAGYRPRFNSLNLFCVPQKHNVSYVPGFAPVARYAISGWFRDR